MPKGWKVLVGGCGGARPRLAQELVKGVETEDVIALVDKIVRYYKANAKPHQRLGVMIEKMGFDAFKSAMLGY